MTLLWKSPDEHPWTRARQREADESRKRMRIRMAQLRLLRDIDNDPELNATIDAEQAHPDYNDKNLPE